MQIETYTILVVDDSPVNREYLADILEEDCYRVIKADSGEECIRVVAAEHPILILLDVVMPGIDGLETLRMLKANRTTSGSSVIMLTSLDDQESKLKAFELGAVDFITKSAHHAEVRARVHVHVRLAIQNRELIAARAENIQQISAAQQSLLIEPKDIPAATFSIYYHSLHEAGGDFYDVIRVADGVFFYFIADIAGHDIGTSYVSPAIKVLLKQFATPAYSVEESIAFMNGILVQTVLKENYLTAFALRINRRVGKAIFLAAGHPPAIFIPKNGPIRFADCKNPLIGIMDDLTYKSESIDVEPGDRFILYTDGLVETGLNKLPWTETYRELIPIVERLRALSLADLPVALVHAVNAESSADDDIAVFAIEV
jgi:sigma-B regulation protein RsbU (phosphoserine phosphatase)